MSVVPPGMTERLASDACRARTVTDAWTTSEPTWTDSIVVPTLTARRVAYRDSAPVKVATAGLLEVHVAGGVFSVRPCRSRTAIERLALPPAGIEAITPDGRFLFAVGQTSNRLSRYAIDPTTGALAKIGDQPMGMNPNWVEIVDLA